MGIKMNKIKNPLYALIVIMPYATIAVLILTPALLELAYRYGISTKASNGVITFAMLGYAIGPILYGPIASRHGKKRTVYIGVAISLVGILSCIFSYYQHNFILMLVGRLITSLGAVSGMVIAYAVVADYYAEVDARKILSILVILAFAVIPSLAIALGGYITQNFGWIYCLYFLGLYAFVCVLVVYLLADKPDDRSQTLINFDSMLIGYLALLKNKVYMGYISLAGIAVAAVYIYAAKAPIVAVHQIRLNPSEFGYYNLIPYSGYIIALYASSKLSARLLYQHIIVFGLVMMSAGSLLILLASLVNHLSANVLFFGAFIIFCGSAPIVPNSMVLATKSIHDRSFAASFGSFFYMVLAAFLTWLAGLPQMMQSVSYAIAIMFLVMAIFTINRFCLEFIPKNSSSKNRVG